MLSLNFDIDKLVGVDTDNNVGDDDWVMLVMIAILVIMSDNDG